MDLIKIAEEAFATGKQHPSFKAGDTITVAYRIVEGSKERVQLYRGVVIKISGHGEKNGELKRLNEEVLELTHSRLVFFTNISHELRTPLTLIADPVEMLLEDTGIKGKSRELLKMVQRNALALQQYVSLIE